MHARAARMAREVLEKELPTAKGKTDHELTGRLERELRHAGAEDVVVLVSDGQRPPLPAEGRLVGAHTSVVVAIEYNGHWAKVTRNVAGVTSHLAARDGVSSPPPARDSVSASLPPRDGVTELREILSGPYSWETIDDAAAPAVVSLQLAIPSEDRQLYYGDTCLQSKEGLRTL
jgi:hypothetical protein